MFILVKRDRDRFRELELDALLTTIEGINGRVKRHLSSLQHKRLDQRRQIPGRRKGNPKDFYKSLKVLITTLCIIYNPSMLPYPTLSLPLLRIRLHTPPLSKRRFNIQAVTAPKETILP